MDKINYEYREDIKEPDLIILQCSSCSKKLLEVFITGDGPVSQLVAQCPYCGDRSFVKTITGTFKYATANELFIKDIVYNNKIHFITGLNQ